MRRPTPDVGPPAASGSSAAAGPIEADQQSQPPPRQQRRSVAPRLPEPTRFEKLRLQVAGRQGSLDRLREGIEAAWAQQAARDHEHETRSREPGASAADTEAGVLVHEYLQLAGHAYRDRNANLGWGFLHRVRETETLLMTRTELDAVAVSLAAECSGSKVPGWRRDAIQGLLQRMDRPPYPVLPSADSAAGATRTRTLDLRPGRGWPGERDRLRHDAELVREALVIRNGYFSNIYVGVAVTSHRRLWLMVLGLALLSLVVVLFTRVEDLDPQPVPDEAASDVLAHSWILLGMAALGALGSVVSAIQRLAVDPLTGPIPAQLGSFTATVTRPLIGAVAALTVFLAARGGLAVPEEHPGPLVLLAGFTAGLTERLAVYREDSRRGT